MHYKQGCQRTCQYFQDQERREAEKDLVAGE